MEISLIDKILDLKEELLNSKEFLDFKGAELGLENNDEVALLSYKKDMAIVEYEDTLKHYSRNSNEALKSNKLLSEAIFKLNENPLVKEYNSSLDTLNNLLRDIESRIFEGIDD